MVHCKKDRMDYEIQMGRQAYYGYSVCHNTPEVVIYLWSEGDDCTLQRWVVIIDLR